MLVTNTIRFQELDKHTTMQVEFKYTSGFL